MRASALLALLLPVAHAAVDGVVTNQTMEKPQPGATVTLYEIGSEGMKPVETLTADARGAFRFDHSPQGPCLLQAVHDGVAYNRMLPPDAVTTGLQLAVYDSTSESSAAEVVQHMVLLEPIEASLHVNETVIFRNEGKTTYNHPDNGTLRVFLPEQMQGKPRVMVTAPQGMPVEREAAETGEADVYKIDFPIKPGETRFDLTYVLPVPEFGVLTGKVLHKGGPVRIVAPPGVTLQGESISLIGQEPATQASVYDIQGRDYEVEIEGTGSLSSPGGSEGEGGPGMQQIQARIYDRAWEIVGLSLLILALGFALLYRRSGASTSTRGAPSRGKRR